MHVVVRSAGTGCSGGWSGIRAMRGQTRWTVSSRQAQVDAQSELDPERLIVIDRTWAKMNMVRTHGRASYDQRLRTGISRGHRKATIFGARLGPHGMLAPLVLSGPIDQDAFDMWAVDVPVPELSRGDLGIMDNLSCHKVPSLREDRGSGAELLYLPPYRSAFNPIENAFAKLNAMSGKAAERTIDSS